jgi:hypothetical protein
MSHRKQLALGARTLTTHMRGFASRARRSAMLCGRSLVVIAGATWFMRTP